MTAIRFAGTGGQGVQLAGVIFAEAAIRSGWFAACTHTYGPESRGGASHADVLISDTEIDFPKVARLDVLVALSEEGFQRNAAALRSGGVVICDRSAQAGSLDGVVVHALPIAAAAGASGSVQSTNVVALGALGAVTGLITRDQIAAVLATRLHQTAGRNLRALEAGWALGERLTPWYILGASGGSA